MTGVPAAWLRGNPVGPPLSILATGEQPTDKGVGGGLAVRLWGNSVGPLPSASLGQPPRIAPYANDLDKSRCTLTAVSGEPGPHSPCLEGGSKCGGPPDRRRPRTFDTPVPYGRSL